MNNPFPTHLGLDASINLNRWNEADEEELENTLNSGALNPVTSAPTFSTTTLVSQLSRSQTSVPFTCSPPSQFVQLPARMSNNTMQVFNHPAAQQQYTTGDPSPPPIAKPSSWAPQQQDVVLHGGQGIADSPSISTVGMSASPLADVLSSMPPQNLGVQNLTLPSTTLDLSDIKWGILDPTVTIKRSGSTESPAQEEERLTIQEDM